MNWTLWIALFEVVLLTGAIVAVLRIWPGR